MCAEEQGGNFTDCKNLGLTEQAFDQTVECNVRSKENCSE